MSFPLIPLKRAARLDVETLPESTDPSTLISYCDISNVTYGEPIVWPDPIEFGRAPSRARRVVKDGDTLISTVRTYLKTIATVHSPPGNATASTGFCVLTPSQHIDSRYLGYAAQSNETLAQIARYSEGVSYPAISPNRLGRIKIAAPEIETQRLIVDYLDREIAEIDSLILDQKSALELLRVRWNSEVAFRTQNGLDGSPAQRASAQTWPTAPGHWRKTRLKSTIRSAKNGSWGEEPKLGETTVRCIRVADFDKMHGSVHDLNPTERSYPQDQVSRTALHPGDLIIEKSGGGPTTPVGNVVLYEGAGGEMYSNFVARIELARGIDPYYALYLHQGLYASGVTHRSIKQTTGIQNLDATAYFDEPIFLPPLDEQREIGAHLRVRRAELDAITSDLTRAITLAKERRAALITAAVTGQIDVTAKHRPAAEQLEDDIKELS